MDEDPVLYVYRCRECRHAGEVRLFGDAHDGAPHECSACGAKVFLEWEGGVTFEGVPARRPAVEAERWRERHGYTGRGGVVVINDGVADAWVNELRNASTGSPAASRLARTAKAGQQLAATSTMEHSCGSRTNPFPTKRRCTYDVLPKPYQICPPRRTNDLAPDDQDSFVEQLHSVAPACAGFGTSSRPRDGVLRSGYGAHGIR